MRWSPQRRSTDVQRSPLRRSTEARQIHSMNVSRISGKHIIPINNDKIGRYLGHAPLLCDYMEKTGVWCLSTVFSHALESIKAATYRNSNNNNQCIRFSPIVLACKCVTRTSFIVDFCVYDRKQQTTKKQRRRTANEEYRYSVAMYKYWM